MLWFTLAFADEAAAGAAAARLACEGFACDLRRDSSWLVVASPAGADADLRAARRTMNEVATSCGGVFLGQGGHRVVGLPAAPGEV